MSITVARIVKVTQALPPAPEGALNLNCLNWFPNNTLNGIPLYEVVPYHLRAEPEDPTQQGPLFENLWQGSKVYGAVTAQYEIKANKVIWSHRGEVHVENGQVNAAYWAWRRKLMGNPYAVRYPNGYNGRHECLCALWNDNGIWLTLSYIPARKMIYCKEYARLVQRTRAYQMLKQLFDAGTSLQICEMDVRPGPVNEEVLRYELNNPKQAFGHGYVLAACLLGLTNIFNE